MRSALNDVSRCTRVLPPKVRVLRDSVAPKLLSQVSFFVVSEFERNHLFVVTSPLEPFVSILPTVTAPRIRTIA